MTIIIQNIPVIENLINHWSTTRYLWTFIVHVYCSR